MYSEDQIQQYLGHIGFPHDKHPADRLEFLTELQRRQLERVPFENLSLHYSPKKELSLDPEDLFDKIVCRSRGGYCLENNNFFGHILRSLGFDYIYVAARVKRPAPDSNGSNWFGWTHLAVLVRVQQQQYLVDVGHGSAGPTKPIPLVANTIISGIQKQQLRLEYRSLPEHTDRNQRVWVYSHREDDESPWVEAYCFTDQECLTTDFEVMNHLPMTSPQSLFTQNVLVQRFLANENNSSLIGSVILFRDRLKLNMPKEGVTEHTLKSEAERVAAIERWFRIRLDAKDRGGIQGTPSELAP